MSYGMWLTSVGDGHILAMVFTYLRPDSKSLPFICSQRGEPSVSIDGAGSRLISSILSTVVREGAEPAPVRLR